MSDNVETLVTIAAEKPADASKMKRPARAQDIDTRKKDGEQASTTRRERKNRPEATWLESLEQGRIKFDKQAKQIFLDSYKKTGLKGRAAEKAEVTMKTVDRHKENDPDFAEAYKQAEAYYHDDFVNHSWNLARHGIVRRRFDRAGNIVEESVEYPIRLIELELKKIDAGYRERQSIELNQSDLGVLLAPDAMTPEDWIESQNSKNESKEAPVSTKEDSEGENHGKPALAIKAA